MAIEVEPGEKLKTEVKVKNPSEEKSFDYGVRTQYDSKGKKCTKVPKLPPGKTDKVRTVWKIPETFPPGKYDLFTQLFSNPKCRGFSLDSKRVPDAIKVKKGGKDAEILTIWIIYKYFWFTWPKKEKVWSKEGKRLVDTVSFPKPGYLIGVQTEFRSTTNQTFKIFQGCSIKNPKGEWFNYKPKVVDKLKPGQKTKVKWSPKKKACVKTNGTKKKTILDKSGKYDLVVALWKKKVPAPGYCYDVKMDGKIQRKTLDDIIKVG